MNRTRAEQILQHVRRIGGSITEIEVVLDTEALPVGDFQFIDRSLRLLRGEADSLVQYMEGMIADPSRIDI